MPEPSPPNSPTCRLDERPVAGQDHGKEVVQEVRFGTTRYGTNVGIKVKFATCKRVTRALLLRTTEENAAQEGEVIKRIFCQERLYENMQRLQQGLEFLWKTEYPLP